MESYEPEHLNRWTRPDSYMGATWYDHYGSGVGRHRDSDCLERANFRAMLNALGFDADECASDDCPLVDDNEPTRVVVRENHWAVGWVEWIAVHYTDVDGLRIADERAARLQDYPILDEELWSEYEDTDCAETWSNCFDRAERAAYLRKHASLEWLPVEPISVPLGVPSLPGMSDVTLSLERERLERVARFRSLRACLRGGWYEAANLLPCPSDLLC